MCRLPDFTSNVAHLQPRTLPIGLDGRVWEQRWSSLRVGEGRDDFERLAWMVAVELRRLKTWKLGRLKFNLH